MQHKHAQYTQYSVLTVNSIPKNKDRFFFMSSKNVSYRCSLLKIYTYRFKDKYESDHTKAVNCSIPNESQKQPW